MAGDNDASLEPAMVVERRVSEVMTTPVRSVATTTPLQEAVQLISEHHISGLPVLSDKSGRGMRMLWSRRASTPI